MKVAAIGAGVAAIGVIPYRPMIFQGESMAPTYRSGEFVWTIPVDRPLRRGDVVVVQMPSGPIVKRIAKLPGDPLIQMEADGEYVDLIDVAPKPGARLGPKFRVSKVPAGCVYLLGDNNAVSLDSRIFGAVPESRVIRLLADSRPNRAPKPNIPGTLPRQNNLVIRHG